MLKGTAKASKTNKHSSKRRNGSAHNGSTPNATATGGASDRAPKQQKEEAARKAACVPPNCTSAPLLEDAAFVDIVLAIVKAYTTKLLEDFNNHREPHCAEAACGQHNSSDVSCCLHVCLSCGVGPFCDLHATRHSFTNTTAGTGFAAATGGSRFSSLPASKIQHHGNKPNAANLSASHHCHTVFLSLRTQLAVCFSCPPITSLSGNFHHNLRGSSFVAKHHQNSQRHVLPNLRLSHAFQLFHEAMQLRDDYVTGYLKNVSIVSSALHPRYVRDLTAHPQYGLHGIENLSNTCCLSVVVQALVKTPVFREYMLARMHQCQPHPAAASTTSTPLDCMADFATRDVYKCLTCALSKATIDMFALPVGDVFDPCSIVCSVKRILAARNWQWSSAEQHDPAEILDKVLETIEREAELAGETSRISPLLSGRRAVVMRDDHHMHQVMFGAEKEHPNGGDMRSTSQCGSGGSFTKRLKVSAPQEHSVMVTSMRTRHPSTVSTASSGNNSGKSVEIISGGCIAAAPNLSSTLTARTPSPSSSSTNVAASGRTLRSATAGSTSSARTVASASTAITDTNQRKNINSASLAVPVLTDNFVDVIFRGLILLIRRCPDCNEGDSVTVDKFTILYLSIDGSKADNEHATSAARQQTEAADGVTSPTTSTASSSSTTVSGVSANQATNSSTEETTAGTTQASANPSSGENTTVANGDEEEEDEQPPSSSSNTATSPNIIEPTSHNNITLEQRIDGFVCEHVLDNVMCNICLKKQKIQKTRFALLPPILIFTLKRYSTQSRKKASSKQHATDAAQSSAANANAKNAEKAKKSAKKPTKSSSTVKLESDAVSPAVVSVAPAAATSNPGTFHKSQVIVAYPLELDMSPYCADRYIMNDFAAAATTNSHANLSHHHESTEDVNFVYELYCVVQHLGQELDKGHYVCWVKHISGKWFYFDDRNVLHSNLEYVLTREAYMLFYRRKRLVSDVEQLISEIRLGTAAAQAAANEAAAAQRHDRFKQTTILLETLAKDVMEIGEDADAAASGSSAKGITTGSAEVATTVAGKTDG